MSTVTRGNHYLWLCLAASAVTFTGFWFTYFGPISSGHYPPTSPTVHLHGWTFFLWYLLLPLQAGLIGARKIRLHRTLGYSSIALAALMIGTGLVVIGTQMKLAQMPDGQPFWRENGPAIFVTLALFALFYTLSVRARRNRELHKRYMLLASVAALGAAAFRIMVQFVGFTTAATVGGILMTNLLTVAAILTERARGEGINHIFAWGLPVTLGAEIGIYVLTPTVIGEWLSRALASLGAALAPLY